MDQVNWCFLPFPLRYSRDDEKREEVLFPHLTAGQIAGPPALRRPSRRWESGGTADLRPRRVNSRVVGLAGGGVVVEP